MRSTLRIFASLALAAVLALPLAVTGCRDHGHHDRDDRGQQPQPAAAEPAPAPAPASNEASYRQWEQDTHREHRDLNQRTAQEQHEYQDWRTAHQHR